MSNLGTQNINQSYGYLLQVPYGLNENLINVTDGAGTNSGLSLDSLLNVGVFNLIISGGLASAPSSIVPFELGVLGTGTCFISANAPLLFYQAGVPVLELATSGHLLINSPGTDVSFLTVNGDTTTNACYMQSLSTEAYTSFTYGILIDYNYISSTAQISLGTTDSLAIYAGGYANGTPVVSVTSTGINSTAIGTDITSTGAFTTLTASSSVSGTGFTSLFASPPTIGSTVPNTGAFTNLSASGNISGNGFSNYLASPPPIGSGIAAAGSFTNLSASSTVSGVGFNTYLASPPSIGGTAPAPGSFTSLTATSVGTSGVLAKTGGLTAVTAVAGSLTLATGGVTLATQTMAAGSVWRVVAYGTYAAVSSASSTNIRQFTVSCFWGSTALTAVTTGNVLVAATAQTTSWKVELEISGSSATAAWCTAVLSAEVTSATIPLNYTSTAASVTGLTTTSTLDFRVGQTGTATAGDTINVHSVTMERIK